MKIYGKRIGLAMMPHATREEMTSDVIEAIANKRAAFALYYAELRKPAYLARYRFAVCTDTARDFRMGRNRCNADPLSEAR